MGDIRSSNKDVVGPQKDNNMPSSSDVSSMTSHGSSQKSKGCNCLTKVSNAIIKGMESFFRTVGEAIGKYPWATMLACTLLTAAFAPALALFFYQEWDNDKLWVPLGSQSLEDKQFVEEHFPSVNRFEVMIPEADNVLTPQVVQAMLDVDKEVKAIQSQPSGFTWDQLCARLGPQCWSTSILELWSFNETVIRNLNQADILNAVNTITVSPVYGSEFNASQYLGDIARDPATGDITGAQAALMQWVISPNGTDDNEYAGTLEDIEDWEEQFLVIGETGKPEFSELYYFATKTFSEEGGGAISGDVLYLAVGYIIVIIFVAIVLGRFTKIRHRIYVALAGILCIGLAIICSFGLCSYAGLFYGPVHSVLPFLLLGIGVDDMFVICQALDQLSSDTQKLTTKDRIGLALKDAGVSITVTSLTDILAFAVGSSTTIPALRSFCAYAAVGVFFTFLFQATFLVACLAYDDLRIHQDRDACCCCIVHKDHVPNQCSNRLLVQMSFDKFYAPLMTKLATKICVVLATLGFLGAGLYGVINLEQDFDPAWFLPAGSYSKAFVDAYDTYFPSVGVSAAVFYGDINYYTDYETLEDMYFDVRADPYVSSSTVDCWFYSYRAWLNTTTDPRVPPLVDPVTHYPTTENNFYTALSYYLTTEGSRFISSLDITDTIPARVEASQMKFLHINLPDAAAEIRAMDSVRAVVASYGYPPEENFVYSSSYLTFESNKVIKSELFRNLGLAFLCIFLMTLILLANIPVCLLVCLCVVMALVDVGGFMYFWDLTIDTVTAINLILAIGLTVDYSAHIAHTFMTVRGSRDERTSQTLSIIGPPVLFGGFSTFLAFVVLAGSESYVFSTFFKEFLLVVVFGLFHGMVLLPVLLSWMGPKAYDFVLSGEADDNRSEIISAYENTAFHGHLDKSASKAENGHGPSIEMNLPSSKEEKHDDLTVNNSNPNQTPASDVNTPNYPDSRTSTHPGLGRHPTATKVHQLETNGVSVTSVPPPPHSLPYADSNNSSSSFTDTTSPYVTSIQL